MSVFQRILGAHGEKETEQRKKVEILDGPQPHNPYTELLILQQHTDIVRLLVCIDSKRCVSAGDDGKAVVWNVQVGIKLAVLTGHNRPISCMLHLKSEEDGSDWILTGSSDKQIRVFAVDSGQCMLVITEHASSVKCLLPLCVDDLFCSGGQDLCLWNQKGKLLHAYIRSKEEADVCHLISIRNERFVAAAERLLTVYLITIPIDSEEREITVVKRLPQHREAIRSLVNISDSSFASGSIDGTIVLWSTQSLLPTRYFNTRSDYEGPDHLYPYSVQYMLAVEQRYLIAAIGSGFSLYDTLTGRLLVEKKLAHFSKILHLTFGFDGLFMATCSEDGTIRLWGHGPLFNEASDYQREPLETFIGMSFEELRQIPSSKPAMEPVLLGECLAHSGAVQMLVDFGLEGIVSCGMDALVLVWKNAELQRRFRNQMLQDKVFCTSGVV